jgi:hypothetical protein
VHSRTFLLLLVKLLGTGMQFRHPELLYALFLLLIPIIVHLFQLRKFKKEQFTNVAFLKKLDLQTRKSNSIKKWLVLLTRMGIIAMAVLAFAQPFLTASKTATQEKENLIYLDNSFSMQAKGASGPLLKQAVQELITSVPEETTFTLVTNTEVYKDTKIDAIRNTLLELPYSSNELTTTALNLRAQKYLSNAAGTLKRLVVISDFQQGRATQLDSSLNEVHYVQLSPTNISNLSIDTLFVRTQTANTLTLEAKINAQQPIETGVPISIYNKSQLIAKATASFENTATASVDFEIEKQSNIQGTLSIEDPILSYDNELFFSLDTATPINVISINDAENDFLKRLFGSKEFNYKAVSSSNLDYSVLSQYNLVVLNGLQDLPLSLGNALASFKNNGGTVFVILNEDIEVLNTNNFLALLGTSRVIKSVKKSRLVTSINYDHPIYKNVFDKQTDNFQYPSVSASYSLASADALLSFQDGNPFITAEKGLYITASRFNSASTNFKNSPLIVPTLYNIAKESLALPELYYTTGVKNDFDVITDVSQDNILSLETVGNTEASIIPLQRKYPNKVTITTNELPVKAGNYLVKNKDSVLQGVSFNYSRNESQLLYALDTNKEGINYHNSVVNLFKEFKEQDSILSLWKWFVIFALFFMLMEMLILKFFK